MNASACPRPAIRSGRLFLYAHPGGSGATQHGSAIIPRWRCGVIRSLAAPIISRSTCLMARPLLSKACASSRSIAHRCSVAVLPTPLPLPFGLAGVGDSYSLVAANFRTGDPPPAGRDEMLLAVDATFPGVTLTQVHGWLFHVDFANPGNSTIGVGADHTPNAEITVNPFVQAWTASTYNPCATAGNHAKAGYSGR